MRILFGARYAALGLVSLAGVACHAHATAQQQAQGAAQPAAAVPAQGPQPSVYGSRLLSSAGVAPKVEWTAEEQQKDIAIRELSRSASASLHLVRARGAEKPHTHDEHDLVVVLLSGSVRAHLGDQIIDAQAGDTLTIPRGLPHWVENTGADPSLSLAVFSPPFDGKDRRFIER